MTVPAGVTYTVVIPTTGRDALHTLLRALDAADGPAPREIIVVDDRPLHTAALALPATDVALRVLRSGGLGPAAARNSGWRQATTEWVAFLDDDVCTPADWPSRLVADLAELPADVAGSQGRIHVPDPPDGRRPTDDERGTVALAGAWWITADMAYRRDALAEVGGFDERFPRAYREDADLALRVRETGRRLVSGARVTVHPARQGDFLASVRAQRGNADNALLRHKFGARWRGLIGEGSGSLGRHAVTTLAGAVAVAAGAAAPWYRPPRRVAAAAAGVWAGSTAEFTWRRVRPGPRSRDEVARMAVSSALIPPAACWHRALGELRRRSGYFGRAIPPREAAPVASSGIARPEYPTSATGALAAVLFDRDDTLIEDGPYLADADRVRPVPGAEAVLGELRRAGVPLGVVSNQSGVATGRITSEQLAEVNARVAELLGPFDTWQVCVHADGDDCVCRKPRPGLIEKAAADLGVAPADCVVIGDTGADVDAALAAGARGVLVPTERTRAEEVERARRDGALATDLAEAVALASRAVRRGAEA